MGLLNFVDLGLADSRLQSKALKLGWGNAVVLPRFSIESRQDLNKAAAQAGACIVFSKSGDLLRKTVSLSRSPMLVDAFSVPNFYRDEGLIRAIAQENSSRPVGFELACSQFLRCSFVFRARFVSQATSFVKKCFKLDAPVIVTSGAVDDFELKSPRETIALAELFGFSQMQASAAISRLPLKFISQQVE